MADNVNYTEPGSGTAFRTIEIDSKHIQAITSGDLTLASSNTTPITASGDTEVIAAPGASNKLLIYYIHVSNAGSTSIHVGFKEGSGNVMYRSYMPQGKDFAHNIKPGFWELAANTALNLNLSATGGSINYTVEYETVAV